MTRPAGTRPRLTTVAGALLAFSLVSGVITVLPGRADAAMTGPAPAAVGWRATSRSVDRGGVEIIRLIRDDPLTRAQLAIFPRSELRRLRSVLASDQLVGGSGRDLPTSMCARLHCHAAINGDRYVPSGHDAGRPYGGVATGGNLIATQPLPPDDPYAHLLIGTNGSMDGTIAFPIPVSPKVISGEVTLPVGVNRQPSGNQITVLDQRYHPDSRTPPGTVEYLLTRLGGSSGGQALTPLARREGSGPIPEGGLVVAANGPSAIDAAEAWWAATLAANGATYTSGSEGVRDIIGGSPLLLHDSAYGFPLGDSDGRQPRTIIGWDHSRLLLVAIDGRRPGWSGGATYIEAAQLMAWLGATDALNVDGGGSTTFVDHGRLTNWPSGGVQEAAAQAIVLMPPENRVAPPPPARSLDAACPPGRVPANPFPDASGNVHEAAIACMAWWRVTSGTASGTYEPGLSVRRDQMATFLARLLARSGVPLPLNPPDAFSDDEGSVHESAINKMAAMGVVGGQTDSTFAPSGAATRGQMAAFLARAMPLATDAPLANTTDYYADDSGHHHERFINPITEARVAGGTADGRYDLRAPVRRDQMASFLARVLSAAVEAGQTQPPR